MSTRDVSELRPDTAQRARAFIAAADRAGRPILITCTYRSPAEQARLFVRGRRRLDIEARARELEGVWGRPDLAEILLAETPVPDARVVTNAAPGQSTHQWRGALDFVPLVDGKPFWGAETQEDLDIWSELGRIAMDCGFEWGGTWTRFREYPHVEEPLIDWRELIRGGGDAVAAGSGVGPRGGELGGVGGDAGAGV